MLGAIAGDIFGAAYEGQPITTESFDLFEEAQCFKDAGLVKLGFAGYATILVASSTKIKSRQEDRDHSSTALLLNDGEQGKGVIRRTLIKPGCFGTIVWRGLLRL